MTRTRVIQAVLFLLFLFLLGASYFPLPEWIPQHGFMRMDPLLILGDMVSSRTLSGLPVLLPAIVLVVSTLLIGRFFCSHICPMGTVQDLAGFSFKPETSITPGQRLRLLPVKYILLIFLLATALFGLNVTHWASPLSLVSRFFVLFVFPLLQALAKPFLLLTDTSSSEIPRWSQTILLQQNRYTGMIFFTLLMTAVLLLIRLEKRFWCKYLCPTGAMLAFFSRFSLMQRKVSLDCNVCGKCRKICPMQAIPDTPSDTHAGGECIRCLSCLDNCTQRAVSFEPPWIVQQSSPLMLPGRRQVLGTITSGAVLGFLGTFSLLEYRPGGEAGTIMPPELVRPPGSKPEDIFLGKCIRCGLCMKVCPTNMLQPALFETGLSGMYAPLARARRGPCEPQCNACGQICPTRAITPLPLEQKVWAKMGTAVLYPHKCLAWEYDKACLICDEACPYDAITLERVSGHSVPVPIVHENKCAGCGFCEYRCPIQALAAIRVSPMNALRLKDGNYRTKAKEANLHISRAAKAKPGTKPQPQNGLPPGFTE